MNGEIVDNGDFGEVQPSLAPKSDKSGGGPQLSARHIEGYKAAFAEAFGETPEHAEASEQAHMLVRLMRLICRPMTLDEIAETLAEMNAAAQSDIL